MSPTVLDTLESRFQLNQIYARCGAILVAVNPCHKLADNPSLETISTSPHVRQVAQAAIDGLRRTGQHQTVLISGDSGSGKTSSVNMIIEHLGSLGSVAPTDLHIDMCTQIANLLPPINMLLESIGNAKTSLNPNSSRFGRYIELRFSQRLGTLLSANVQAFLPETSRVVHQMAGEQNYHIFHYLIQGADAAMQDKFGINHACKWNYLVDTNADDLRKTETGFRDVNTALSLLGVDPVPTWSLVAAILHLGNVEFSPTGGGWAAEINRATSSFHLIHVSKLLGVSEEGLEALFTHKSIIARNEVFQKPLSLQEALAMRDGLSKFLYAHLLEWIVFKINEALQPPGKKEQLTEDVGRIGIFDIYGFEMFDRNGFEQLMINYANEKLHSVFNDMIFRNQQEEYANENISWMPVNFTDNTSTLATLENRCGILDLLNEESRLKHGNEESFLIRVNALTKQQSPTKSFISSTSPNRRPGRARSTFSVSHYAGNVEYEVEGCVEKNRDVVPEDITHVVAQSDNEFVCRLLQLGQGNNLVGPHTPSLKNSSTTDRRDSGVDNLNEVKAAAAVANRGISTLGRAKSNTIAFRFQNSLASMLKILTYSHTHFIRCIKPNAILKAGIFDRNFVQLQLTSCGLRAAVKMQKYGFGSHVKYTFPQFFTKYWLLVVDDNESESCSARNILQRYTSREYKSDWVIGKTRVYMTPGLDDILQKALQQRLMRYAITMQRYIRGWCTRKQIRICHQQATTIQAVYRGREQRRQYRNMRNAAIVLQRWWRYTCAVKKCPQTIHQIYLLTDFQTTSPTINKDLPSHEQEVLEAKNNQNNSHLVPTVTSTNTLEYQDTTSIMQTPSMNTFSLKQQMRSVCTWMTSPYIVIKAMPLLLEISVVAIHLVAPSLGRRPWMLALTGVLLGRRIL